MLFAACEGPVGPEGPTGPEGPAAEFITVTRTLRVSDFQRSSGILSAVYTISEITSKTLQDGIVIVQICSDTTRPICISGNNHELGWSNAVNTGSVILFWNSSSTALLRRFLDEIADELRITIIMPVVETN